MVNNNVQVKKFQITVHAVTRLTDESNGFYILVTNVQLRNSEYSD